MSKIALLIRALPLIASLGDKVMEWFKKDPKAAKEKLIFVGIMTVVLIALAYAAGEQNVQIGVEAVKQLCNEVDC